MGRLGRVVGASARVAGTACVGRSAVGACAFWDGLDRRAAGRSADVAGSGCCFAAVAGGRSAGAGDGVDAVASVAEAVGVAAADPAERDGCDGGHVVGYLAGRAVYVDDAAG